MGVDLIGITGHKLKMKEIIEFPKALDAWSDLRSYLIENDMVATTRMDFKSTWKKAPDPEAIEKLWKEYETDTVSQSNWIETYFGDINIYRGNLTIEIDGIQKYANFRYNESTLKAINICRIIAKNLNEDKVIFCPDSAYPTSEIYDYASDGISPNEIIKKGIDKFGEIPKGISKGRKNYFFVDYVNEPIGELLDWDKEETFWRWNEKRGQYEQNIN